MTFWDNIGERFRALGEQFLEWVILLSLALVVLIVGRWLIGLIRDWTEGILESRPVEPVWVRSGVSTALAGTTQTPASLVANILQAYLTVALLLIVARILRVTSVENLLERLLAWMPLLLLAAAIVIVAAAAGQWVSNLVRPFAEERGVVWLATTVHIAVVVFGVLFAMELMRIEFAEDIVKIVVAAAAVAGAIAFGVGGIDAGKRWWARYGMPRGGPPPPMA